MRRHPWTHRHTKKKQKKKPHTVKDAYTALHASGPPERLPWESVPKQLTLRQVHEHGGAPTETGHGLTEETSFMPSSLGLTKAACGLLAWATPPPIPTDVSQHHPVMQAETLQVGHCAEKPPQQCELTGRDNVSTSINHPITKHLNVSLDKSTSSVNDHLHFRWPQRKKEKKRTKSLATYFVRKYNIEWAGFSFSLSSMNALRMHASSIKIPNICLAQADVFLSVMVVSQSAACTARFPFLFKTLSNACQESEKRK